MAVQLDEDEVVSRVKSFRRRIYVPWYYYLVLFIPLAARLLGAPASNAMLMTGGVLLFSAAVCIRALVLGLRPNPLAGVEPSVYRPWLREFNAPARRLNVVIFSVTLGFILWSSLYRGAPLTGAALAMISGSVLFCGLITALFLLDVKLLPRKYRTIEDLELVGALKNRATRWSGLLVSAVAVAAYPAQALWPAAGPAILAGLIWTACAGPLLIFAWLEYRTEAYA
jgi:hypothetical protein